MRFAAQLMPPSWQDYYHTQAQPDQYTIITAQLAVKSSALAVHAVRQLG